MARLDVMKEHAKIHQTIHGGSGVRKDSTTDVQGSGHRLADGGRVRNVAMSASLSGSGPAKPHNVSVQSLVGKLPMGSSHNVPMNSGMAKPKVGINERGPQPHKKLGNGKPIGTSNAMKPTIAKTRAHTAILAKVGGGK